VRYLRELEQKLRARLVELGRLEWHRQLCVRLIEDNARASEVDANSVWRVRGHDLLDETGLAVLRELWHWREKDALRTGRPPFFILKHETLSDISEQASKGGTKAVKLPPYLTPKRRHGVLEAVERGLDVPEADRPQHIRVNSRRMTRPELDYADVLKERRDKRGVELEIDPTIIASRGTLFALARKDPGEWERLLSWQREILQD
jgi:ribonuclease D